MKIGNKEIKCIDVYKRNKYIATIDSNGNSNNTRIKLIDYLGNISIYYDGIFNEILIAKLSINNHNVIITNYDVYSINVTYEFVEKKNISIQENKLIMLKYDDEFKKKMKLQKEEIMKKEKEEIMKNFPLIMENINKEIKKSIIESIDNKWEMYFTLERKEYEFLKDEIIDFLKEEGFDKIKFKDNFINGLGNYTLIVEGNLDK